MTEEEFWAIVKNMPEPKQIFYRLYYNDHNDPVIYSMEDLPGNYIDVDAETYARAPTNVKVFDGKLIYIEPKITIRKLRPSVTRGTACDPQDVCIVVDPADKHTKWSLNE